MKSLINKSLYASLILTMSAFSASAADSDHDILKMMKNLKHRGYNVLTEFEAKKDGKYEIEGINRQGEKFEIILDSLKDPLPYKNKLDMVTLTKKIIKLGYHDITKIEFEKNNYKINAMNQNNEQVTLLVDARSWQVMNHANEVMGMLDSEDHPFPVSEKYYLKKMTCDEFLKIEEDMRPTVVAWATAYSKKNHKHKEAHFDTDKVHVLTPVLVKNCEEDSKEYFWTKNSKYLD